MTDSPPPAAAEFQSTHWSLVAAAADPRAEGARTALAELCTAYWYPLYAFLRRRGHGPDESQDLTQGFFAELLDHGYLASADRERGKFRTFLLTAASRFAGKELARAAAQKRGGGQTVLALDFQDGETRYLREPANRWTAERLFDRRWALTLLDRTLAELRKEFVASGKQTQFDELKIYLTGESGAPPLSSAATRLGLTEGAVKTAVHRLRERYRDRLRREVAQTVSTADEIRDEMQLLLAALRGD